MPLNIDHPKSILQVNIIDHYCLQILTLHRLQDDWSDGDQLDDILDALTVGVLQAGPRTAIPSYARIGSATSTLCVPPTEAGYKKLTAERAKDNKKGKRKGGRKGGRKTAVPDAPTTPSTPHLGGRKRHATPSPEAALPKLRLRRKTAQDRFVFQYW